VTCICMGRRGATNYHASLLCRRRGSGRFGVTQAPGCSFSSGTPYTRLGTSMHCVLVRYIVRNKFPLVGSTVLAPQNVVDMMLEFEVIDRSPMSHTASSFPRDWIRSELINIYKKS
jgi:hypothetical protein